MQLGKECFVVVNPVAGGGKAKVILEIIMSALKRIGVNSHIYQTQKTEDLIPVLNEAEQIQCHSVICIGGDGTTNGVANSLLKKNSNKTLPLVVVPAGTGGDYAKSIYQNKIPCNEEEWLEFLSNAKEELIDVGVIKILESLEDQNNKEIYFINILGIGISSKIVQDKNAWAPSMKVLPFGLSTSLGYILPTLSNIVTYPASLLDIEIDGQSFQKEIKAIFVAKGKYSGGGMKFGANAELSDGLFDFLICSHLRAKDLYKNIQTLYNGKFEQLDFIQKIKGAQMRFSVQSDGSKPHSIDIEYDGEVLRGIKKAEIQVLPRRLSVLRKV